MDIKDKVALITGSTSGIGKSVAQKLLNLGYKVIVSSEKELVESEALKDFENNQNAIYLKCDIAQKSDIEIVRDLIKSRFGRLDLLVCNAGIMPRPCGIDDITEEVMEKTLNVNLKGTFWTLKLLGNLIKDTSRQGAIVNMTSVDGVIGEPYGVMYSTTKAGIISLTKSFARYFREPLIRVNAIAPGLIDTPLSASTGEDPSWTTDLSIIQRMGKPEEVADSVVYLLSDESSFITGQILAVDGGFTLK